MGGIGGKGKGRKGFLYNSHAWFVFFSFPFFFITGGFDIKTFLLLLLLFVINLNLS